MRKVLEKLTANEHLSREESMAIMMDIGSGAYSEIEIAAFLASYMTKHLTVDELTGFRDALLQLCIPVHLGGLPIIDLCGTGGDGKDTFNISTIASFIVAGAGYKVAKHGNYGVSSISGSSNVMEYLGYQFTNDNDKLIRSIEKANICFMHAPLFHPAMKWVAPVRRALKTKTIFNMLGPLVNPARPRHQLVGVFKLELARTYHFILQELGISYKVVHSTDGYDEISLTDHFKVFYPEGESFLRPSDLGFNLFRPEDLFSGHSIENAAKIMIDILEGKGSLAQNSAVLANAAMAISCFETKVGFEHNLAKAKESLGSGAAYNCLKRILE